MFYVGIALMNNILVVAAHPDDEVLGCGGAIVNHTKNGDKVHIIYMTDGVSSRKKNKLNILARNRNAIEACRILDVQNPIFLDFPDNRMDKLDLLSIVQILETLIDKIRPSVIYTHHVGDLNIDHQITHKAVITACRPLPNFYVRKILSFEVLSSTGWTGYSADNTFTPNYFIDISKNMELKLSAMNAYGSELMEFPHSRSIEAINSLAIYRGTSVGMEAAEAFMVIRHLA